MGLLLIFVGCSEEVVKIDQLVDDRLTKTIKVIASVGNEELGTRVAIEQDGLDVKLTWEVGDEIKLLFTDGENFVQSTTIVTAVSNNGRRAEFEVEIPTGSTASTFDLYGYYGGGPLSEDSEEVGYANLPILGPWGASLPAVEAVELVMLKFAATDLDMESPEINVTFQHVGTLFKVFIENASPTTLSDISEVAIFSEDESEVIYAYQNDGSTVAQYDIINGVFVDGTTTFSNELPFLTAGGSDDLNPSEVLELWGWYPPSQEEDHVWPALKLRLNYSGGELVTIDTKPARTSPTAIGRAYHFYATFDGTNLTFSDVVKQKMIDPRDMTQYNIVEIGSQTWMAENLRFYPFDAVVENPEIGSDVNPHYYVYGFEGEFSDPESLQAFILSGTLYNWSAGLNGEVGDANPSGVGICPPGWHIPSGEEWQQLIDFVGPEAGTKLREPIWWQAVSTTGTNEFGFTARPGGIRQNVAPYYQGLGTDGYWITSDVVSVSEMRVVSISNNQEELVFEEVPKDFAASIRCIRN